MNGRQIHAKLRVRAESPPSAGLQTAYLARKSQSSAQTFLKSTMQTTPWFRGRFIQRFPSVLSRKWIAT